MIRKEKMAEEKQELIEQSGCNAQGIRESICKAVDRYFEQLDGHPANGLHDLVISAVEKPLFEKVLEHCGGNQTKAAMMLGINRGTFRKKLKQYGIDL